MINYQIKKYETLQVTLFALACRVIMIIKSRDASRGKNKGIFQAM